MFHYALYPGDEHYHLLERSAGHRTLCGLSTKGSRQNVREWRPPANVGSWPLPTDRQICPLCDAEQDERESSAASGR